jgi:plastocyanin
VSATDRPTTRHVPLALTGAVLVLAALLAGLWLLMRPTTIEVVVPEGTAARIAAGEEVDLLPAGLELRVGDTLEVRNLDEVTHEIGPYTVSSGQTLRQTFTSPGVIQGVCTFTGDEVTIVVR